MLLALSAWLIVPTGIAVQSMQPPPASGLSAPAPAIAQAPGIGVLLPLSGRYRSFGESCQRGIRLALGAVGDRMPVVRTVILDSGGSPAQAASAYQQLATDAGIVAVLGPMLSPEVDAVRSAAQRYGLVTLTFSQRAVPAGGPLFRFALTKEDQAHSLAQYAVEENGLRRWATLHPEDAYGKEIAEQFRIAVESRGGRVVADVSYDPAKNDLQTEAKRLQSRIGFVENEPPRIDGVFLPDSAERLPMLVSYLAFIDVHGVQLLGASGWDRPQELIAAGPSVEGGVFVDGFFVYSFRPEVRTFVDAYRDAYHADPGHARSIRLRCRDAAPRRSGTRGHRSTRGLRRDASTVFAPRRNGGNGPHGGRAHREGTVRPEGRRRNGARAGE